jgi:hypothetical protein
MPEYPQRGVAVVQRQISDGTFTVPGGARRPYCPLRVGFAPFTDRLLPPLFRGASRFSPGDSLRRQCQPRTYRHLTSCGRSCGFPHSDRHPN